MSQPIEVTVSWLNHLRSKLSKWFTHGNEAEMYVQHATAIKELFALMARGETEERRVMERMARWLKVMEAYKVEQIEEMIEYFKLEG